MARKFQKTYTVADTKVTLKQSTVVGRVDLHRNGTLIGYIEALDNTRYLVDCYIFNTIDKAGKWMASNFAKVKPNKAWLPDAYLVSITLQHFDHERDIQREVSKIEELDGKVSQVVRLSPNYNIDAGEFVNQGMYAIIRVEVKEEPAKWMAKYEGTRAPKNGWVKTD